MCKTNKEFALSRGVRMNRELKDRVFRQRVRGRCSKRKEAVNEALLMG